MGPIGAPAPGPTNVVVLSKIPEGCTEQQITAGAGRPEEVLQVCFRPADPEGPGWAIIALSSPEVAKVCCDRLHGKPLHGMLPGMVLEAAMGEGLFGKVRSSNDQDSPWKEARTKDGQVYYYHAVTRQTTWIKPPPEFPSSQQQAMVGGGRSGPVPPRPPANPGAAAQAAIRDAQAIVAAGQSGSIDSPGSSGPVGANLFVYHIPNSWDDYILRQHFEHFGKIFSCRVQKDDSGRPRGFGFVSFDSPMSAQAAIAGMHGFPVEGKWLKVQMKKGDEQAMGDKGGSSGSPGGMIGHTDSVSGINAPPPPAPPPPGGGPAPGNSLRDALSGRPPPPPGGAPGGDMSKGCAGGKGDFSKGDFGGPFGKGGAAVVGGKGDFGGKCDFGKGGKCDFGKGDFGKGKGDFGKADFGGKGGFGGKSDFGGKSVFGGKGGFGKQGPY